MPTASTPLAPAQLETLEELWRKQSAPIAKKLRPGLTREDADRLCEPLHLTLPPEARTLWEWHDGAGEIDGSRWALLPLDIAVERTRLNIDILQHVARQNPGLGMMTWPSSWLVFTETVDGCSGVIDCTPNTRQSSDIFLHDPEQYQQCVGDPPAASSLGKVVGWWIETLASGAERYDSATSSWKRDQDAYPPERVASGFA